MLQLDLNVVTLQSSLLLVQLLPMDAQVGRGGKRAGTRGAAHHRHHVNFFLCRGVGELDSFSFLNITKYPPCQSANALVTPSSFNPDPADLSVKLISHPQFKNGARPRHLASMQAVYR